MVRWNLALVLILATLGPSLAIALIGAASIRALARNPAAAPRIQLAMMAAFIFTAAIAVIALLIFHLNAQRS